MAGVGEASAIVGLVATAGKISKAVIDIASRYKSAKKQIESFGLEVGNLGNILDQLQRLYNRDDLHSDDGVRSVASHMVEQCSDLFSELDNYKDTLYSRPGSVQNVTFRGKAKWVFESSELQYLRARVESMKSNMLLMMTIQCMSSLQRYCAHMTSSIVLANVDSTNLTATPKFERMRSNYISSRSKAMPAYSACRN